MIIMRMNKRKKWRKRGLSRAGSNVSDRSLGRTSTIGFINTFRKSFRRGSQAPRGTPLDGKPEQGDVEVASPGTPVPTALARIVSNASQRTTTSTGEPVSGDESAGSAASSESEEQSDLQMVESTFKGMSKRVVRGKSKRVKESSSKE